MAVRAPSQELYSALLSGEAMKEALRWEDSTPGSGLNDSWRTENRDEYRGHRWVACFPCWAPTTAEEPQGDLGSTIPRLQPTDTKEAQDCHFCASGPPAAEILTHYCYCAAAAAAVSHEFCSLAFREALEAKGASKSPQAHCTQTMVVGIDRAGADPPLPRCSVHTFCKLQQQQQQQQHENRNCCRCCRCCCKHPHRMEGMSLPTQQQQEQLEHKQEQKLCLTHCQATRVRQKHQQQPQQQRRLSRGYLPSRGGLGRRRNEALLQRVGGGYQLYGPISWSSLKAVDAQTNTPVDAARHAATQTAAEAPVEARATPGGATQIAAAARNRQSPKTKEARWFPRQHRCVSSGTFVAERMSAPSGSRGAASHEGPSSCRSSCCCCCCCRGSQDAEAHVAAAEPQCCCPPSTAEPAAAAAVHAPAAGEMPTIILEPRENIRAATASAHRCRSTIVRGCRPQRQQQQQRQPQQQGMLQGFCLSCRKTSRGLPLASSRASGGAQRSPLCEPGEGTLQPGQLGSPPSALQGYAGLLSGALRGSAIESQQAVRPTASST
ncbi:hypothetical protein Emag_007249 [Eimeria magna]